VTRNTSTACKKRLTVFFKFTFHKRLLLFKYYFCHRTFITCTSNVPALGRDRDRAAEKAPEGDDRQTDTHTVGPLYDDVLNVSKEYTVTGRINKRPFRDDNGSSFARSYSCTD